MIRTEDIYKETNGGLDVFCHFFSEIDPANPKKPLKFRHDDKRPTAGLFNKNGVWFIKDHRGNDLRAYSAIEFVKKKHHLSFADSIIWIAERFAPHLLDE